MKACFVVVLVSVFTLLAQFTLCASTPEAILLWPKGAPGETGSIGAEQDMTKPTDKLISGKPVIRLGNITQPTLTVFRPPRDKDTGAAVLVCPGGGYSILAWDLEGTEICTWLNSIGVTGALLKYRVPKRPGLEKYTLPLQDAQRALGLARHRAKEWSLDPRRIGMMGFSAGAHLTAALSTNFEKRTYDPIDAADQVNCRPDFALLIYPGGFTIKSEGDKLSPELKVSADAPPTFLAQAEDDNARVECSLAYYTALKTAKVPAEMHLYPTGGHGYGLRPSGHAVSHWPQRAEEWLRTLGVLKMN